MKLIDGAVGSFPRVLMALVHKRASVDPNRCIHPFLGRSSLMLQALGDAEPTPPSSAVLDTDEIGTPLPAKKRKKTSLSSSFDTTSSSPMGKELTPDQKAIVKMNVIRESADGVVKCCYCEKEISSKNIDRWASHLRGCVKAPEEVKAQIQPIRNATTGSPGASLTPGGNGITGAPSAAAAAGHHAASVNAFTAHAIAGQLGTLTTSAPQNETFKVHVSKDYMKFNAAHFIAHKVRSLLAVEKGSFCEQD